ncbi:MAG TPA: adenylate/guanylate cyclase domain-containing protein [Acidimicrobiia bacterium]|nr:adenylate/guanylate cyclase domain-containing protein [Acidimicrobiia bacterium]
MRCPACGEGVPEGAHFCPECGHALTIRPDERRLVTVLMADMVGFTTLSETADPEHVKNLVDRTFELLVADVRAFGGALDKIVGDELIASFGVPLAHEDDAERAVRAALQMQESLEQLATDESHAVHLRIGINTGEVLVGAMRAGGDLTVMGDVVNTASRLQTSAQPGQIVVGPATYAATRRSVKYEPLGSLTVRGRDEAVEAWVALKATSAPGRRRRGARGALVGRDAEMGVLKHSFSVAKRRHRAQLVLLLGEAGVGKSRLVVEFAERVRAMSGAMVLGGQCAPYGNANAWAPIAEAIRDACACDDHPEVPVRDRVRESVTDVLDDLDAAEVERIVDGLLYILEGFSRPAVEPARARDDAMRSVASYLEGHARRGPLVLGLADLHWADDLVLDLAERLLERLRNLPFVFLGTARPGFEPSWTLAGGHHNALVMHIDPLDSEATAVLARELFGEALTDDVLEFVLERSGGNPFFVEELVALVCEVGQTDSPVEAARVGVLPATLHGLVAARLDALPATERSLLEDCAVVGSSGLVADAVALTAVEHPSNALDALADRDLVIVEDDGFRFKSELVRDVAYGTLTRAERARRHADLADRLQTIDGRLETVAHHLATAAELVADLGTVSGVSSDIRDRAVTALTEAAKPIEEQEHWLASGRLYSRALSLMDPDDTRRWTALLGCARSLEAERKLDEANEHALTVLDEATAAGDHRTVAEALTVLGRVESDGGRYDEAEATLWRAVDAWRALDDTSGVAGALRGLGFIQIFRGDHAEAERLTSEALASFRAAGDQRGEAWALQNLAWISFSLGRLGDAETRLHESAERFAEIGDWGGLGWALGLLAFARFNQGNLDEAEQLASQILTEAHETGDRWAAGMMKVLTANISLWRGRSEHALERGNEALALFREIHDAWGEMMASMPTIRALNNLTRFRECDELLARTATLVSTMHDPSMRENVLGIHTAVSVHRGDTETALTAMHEMLALDEDGDGDGDIGDVDRALVHGMTLLQTARVDEAIAALEDPYRAATDDGPRYALGSAYALALDAAGRPDDALAVCESLSSIRGGSYLDRLVTRLAAGFAFVQHAAASDAASAFDDAQAAAFATDSRLDRAIVIVARSYAFAALGLPSGHELQTEANLTLHGAGFDARGWRTAFELAAQPAAQPLTS